jgi:hypothetical protein
VVVANNLPTGLRDTAKWIAAKDPLATNHIYCTQAADEIERLREALERIASHTGRRMVPAGRRLIDVTHRDLSEIARTALAQENSRG